MAERVAVNHYFGGSSPSFPAKFILSLMGCSETARCSLVNPPARKYTGDGRIVTCSGRLRN